MGISHRSFLIPSTYHLVKIKEISRKKMKMHKSTIFLLTYCLGIFAVLPATSESETKRLRREIKGINTITNDGEKMKQMQKYGVETATHFLKFFQTAINDVEPSVKEIGTATREFKAGIDSLDLEKFNDTETFIGKFQNLYSVDSNDSSQGFRETIAKALKEGTPEYASWTNLIKGNSTTTVGMVIAAIFDCSDQCDGVKTISAWFSSG